MFKGRIEPQSSSDMQEHIVSTEGVLSMQGPTEPNKKVAQRFLQ